MSNETKPTLTKAEIQILISILVTAISDIHKGKLPSDGAGLIQLNALYEKLEEMAK